MNLSKLPTVMYNSIVRSFIHDVRIPIEGCFFVYQGIHRLMTGIHILTSGRVGI